MQLSTEQSKTAPRPYFAVSRILSVIAKNTPEKIEVAVMRQVLSVRYDTLLKNNNMSFKN